MGRPAMIADPNYRAFPVVGGRSSRDRPIHPDGARLFQPPPSCNHVDETNLEGWAGLLGQTESLLRVGRGLRFRARHSGRLVKRTATLHKLALEHNVA